MNQACNISEESRVTSSEDCYRSVFESLPVATEIMDYSGVKVILDDLRVQGIQDFRTYFSENPQAIDQCHEAVSPKVKSNKAFLALYKAKTHKQLCTQMFTTVLTEDSYRGYIELFIALAEGKERFSVETHDRALDGSSIHAMVTWVIAAGFEKIWERVLITIIPFNGMPFKVIST